MSPGARAPLDVRFWAKVQQGEVDECWPWTGSITPDGYGSVGLGNRKEGSSPAHVVAFRLTKGEVPAGHQIDHTCHNATSCPGGKTCSHRRCCNPSHLEDVTPAENKRRGKAGAWQTLKTHCPQNHEYTKENTFPNNGGRGCKICRREWNRRYNAKRKKQKQ